MLGLLSPSCQIMMPAAGMAGCLSKGKYPSLIQEKSTKDHGKGAVSTEGSILWAQTKPLDFSECENDGHYRDNTSDHMYFQVAKSSNIESSLEYDHKKSLLLSIAKSHNGFLSTHARKAIEFMLYRGQSLKMVDLTAAYLLVRLGKHPSGTEVFRKMLECDFEENAVVKQFSDFVTTESGEMALRSLLSRSDERSEPAGYQTTTSDQTETPHSSLASSSQEPTSQDMHASQKTISFESSEKDLNDFKSDNTTTDLDNIYTSEERTISMEKPSQDDVIKTLVEKENETLKNRLLCRICKQREISVVLLPCGHFVLCDVCSEPCQVCPCCQKVVLAEKKVYLG
ncbi:baculoviral IAP repeat-containing protein 8 [Elysia marginata]|uniref:Baculoviral IAP repeat-containing protein 8 n=1 Tax=Elysia marginata TaxID=1093978 RepID=A0AAV4GN74_9GAST|nr:baculoviral IAP repeat-containing protein 8 [Elysia marginata]